MTTVHEVIVHCQKQIKKEPPPEKLLHYLRRLHRLKITVDDLRETGVGKTVNQLSRLDGEVGQFAGKIVEEWKAMVETQGSETKQQQSDSSDSDSNQSDLEIDENYHAESSPQRNSDQGSDDDGEEDNEGEDQDDDDDEEEDDDDDRASNHEENRWVSSPKKEQTSSYNDLDRRRQETPESSSDEDDHEGNDHDDDDDSDDDSDHKSSSENIKVRSPYEDKTTKTITAATPVIKIEPEETPRHRERDKHVSKDHKQHHSHDKIIVKEEKGEKHREKHKDRHHEQKDKEKDREQRDDRQKPRQEESKHRKHEKSKEKEHRKNREEERHHSSSRSSKHENKSSKSHKEKHKASEEKPKPVEEKQKTTEEKPKVNEEKQKTSEEKYKTSEEKYKTIEERPKTSEEKLKTSEGRHKTSEEKHKTGEDKHKSGEGKHRSREEKPRKSNSESPKRKIKEEKPDKFSDSTSIGKEAPAPNSSQSHKRKKPDTQSEDKEKSTKKLKLIESIGSQEIDSTSGINFADVLGCLNKTSSSVGSKTKKPNASSSSSTSSPSKSQKKNGPVESVIPPPPKTVKTESSNNHAAKSSKSHRSHGEGSKSSKTKIKSEPVSYAPPVLTFQPPKPSTTTYPLELGIEDKPFRTRYEDSLLASSNDRPASEFEALSSMMSSRKDRTKVYSGHKTGYVGKIPTLFEMCIRVIQENLDCLGYTGGVPYDILKPALKCATVKQLEEIEFYNSYLQEYTDELWQNHCQRDCKGIKPMEMESWKELYYRCQDERQAKLNFLASKVKKNAELAQPVRKAKLAYVEPSTRGPRFNRSKAATIKNGMKTLKHREEKGPKTGGPSYSASAGGNKASQTNVTIEEAAIIIPSESRAGSAPASSRNNSSTSASTSYTAFKKPKKAPLMQKTMKLIKSLSRR